LRTGQFDTNAFACGNPLQFVTWADAVLIGNLLGDGQLQLGSDLGHILTLARMKSLLQIIWIGFRVDKLDGKQWDFSGLTMKNCRRAEAGAIWRESLYLWWLWRGNG
jgi:hypothetical protein